MIKHKILRIYNLLLCYFGEQHWWPGDSKDEVIIGAILTQNTNWRNVERALRNLNRTHSLSLEKIIRMPKQELIDKIRPAGFYNQKAERLQKVAYFFVNNIREDIPQDFRERLLDIKGIGEETADSILLYAYNLPYFVIDAYTRRIFYRLGVWKLNIKYANAQAMFHKYLKKDPMIYNEYHALLVRLAKENCNKRPKCNTCPLQKECQKLMVH
ncbi:MAG: endonuclease [Candidatus Cloacimonadota bacterium]|nr:MAG: endonuclease [Candidatus Cloacimonadota bacterium]